MAKGKQEPAAAVEADDAGVMLIRKLSPKTVMGKVAIPLKADGTPYVDEDGAATKFPATVLYHVFGLAHDTRVGTSDNGPFCSFLGSFEAIRAKDGKRYQSGQCFVPKAVEDLLVSALRAGQVGDPKAQVEFAIEIGIQFAQTATGYEYYVKNLVKTKNADPLADLRSRITNAHPSLAALAAPK